MSTPKESPRWEKWRKAFGGKRPNLDQMVAHLKAAGAPDFAKWRESRGDRSANLDEYVLEFEPQFGPRFSVETALAEAQAAADPQARIAQLEGIVADLRATMDHRVREQGIAVAQPQIDAQRQRAEVAESALVEARARIAALESPAHESSRNAELLQKVSGLESQLAQAGARAEAAADKMRLLEGFTAVRGMSRDMAPPALDEPAGTASLESFQVRYDGARTDAERSQIVKELEDANAKGRLRKQS